MPTLPLASISAQFTWIDWGIVLGYLVFTTWLGTRMAGRQATMRDFFLGGRKLPWYAVSGSIIATEISAVTFIGVPYVVFKPGGNLTYLQLGIFGSIVARIIVAYVIVPAYYKREIYSPYEYMGHQLGTQVRTMTSGLFLLGATLAQSARIYLTAQIMIVILNAQLRWLTANLGLNELAWAVIVIGVVATGWALIGGITTVIWSNLILFLVFLLGAAVALGTVAYEMGGIGEVLRMGWAAKDSGPWGKFTFFDFDMSPLKEYTIWTAVIASTWGGLFSYGTDQMLVQGMFCCRDARQARRAMIGSSFGQCVTLLVMFVGIGLYTYYQAHPLTGEGLEIYKQNPNRIFPIFICQVVPLGLKGLIMAAAFAAAISTVMGVLAALSQTVMGAFYTPLRQRWQGQRAGGGRKADSAREERHNVIVSRVLIVAWGVILAVAAYLADSVSEKYKSILDLALAMAGYTGGALLACFALSFLPLKVDGRGYMWSAPLSVLFVFALVWHQPWTHVVCWAFAVIILVVWVWKLMTEAMDIAALSNEAERHRRALALVIRDWPQTLVLVVGVALMLWVNYNGYWEGVDDKGNLKYVTVAWPWYAPMGSLVAFIWGYLLARRKPQTVSAES